MIKKITKLLSQNYTRKSFLKIFAAALSAVLFSTLKTKKIFAAGTKKIRDPAEKYQRIMTLSPFRETIFR